MSDSQELKVRAHCLASLRVQGIGLDMEGISRTLGRQPTETHRKGEPDLLKQPFKFDMWALSSPLEGSEPLEAHLVWLYEAIALHLDFVRVLREKYRVDIYCGQTCYTEQAGLIVSPKALRIFTELNIPLDVSLLFLPEDTKDLT